MYPHKNRSELDALLEKHFNDYLNSHYPHHQRNKDHSYILCDQYEPEESLLLENRGLFTKHVKSYIDVHSKGNMKSSQLMTLDLFLPYIDNIKNVRNIIPIKEEIKSIQFEVIFSDYSHIDVFMLTIENKKIIIEVKYKEEIFDRVDSLNSRRINKYLNAYRNINKLMTKKEVSQNDFFEDYQLFRNIYNTFNDELGKPGYFFVVTTKMNVDIINSFNQFAYRLEHLYGFTFIDRIKMIFIEDMNLSNSFIEKYVLIK